MRFAPVTPVPFVPGGEACDTRGPGSAPAHTPDSAGSVPRAPVGIATRGRGRAAAGRAGAGLSRARARAQAALTRTAAQRKIPHAPAPFRTCPRGPCGLVCLPRGPSPATPPAGPARPAVRSHVAGAGLSDRCEPARPRGPGRRSAVDAQRGARRRAASLLTGSCEVRTGGGTRDKGHQAGRARAGSRSRKHGSAGAEFGVLGKGNSCRKSPLNLRLADPTLQ